MVKVLENRAVDLDIVPGTKDSGDLKKQADAATYAAPPTRVAALRCSYKET